MLYWAAMRIAILLAAVAGGLAGCGGDDGPPDPGTLGDAGLPLPPPSCTPASGGGSAQVAAPVQVHALQDRWHEGWLASPAVVDLDGDGTVEIVAPRDERLLVWHADGTVVWQSDAVGRIWSSPVVADLVPSSPGLEVAIASRQNLYAFTAGGQPLPGFPFEWQDEMRSLAAGDVDGDRALELVAVTNNPLDVGGQRDIVIVVEADGRIAAGFPANTGGISGCDDACYVTGGYDQNVALGDVDGNGVVDILAPQDNAYVSLHDGTGRAFDAAPIFDGRTKFAGIRFMVDYRLAQQGYADDEAVDEQGHFTNTAPAIADLDGDRVGEILLLGSVQNAGQDDRKRGVALWVVEKDGTRPAAWVDPPRRPDYLAGLEDWGGNVVGITNQVTVADLDPGRPGPEILFAGFDGKIHLVDAAGQARWSMPYTTSNHVGTGGLVVADLSGDGIPEIVFASYGTQAGDGALFVYDAGGSQLHRVPLPGRGAMAVPTLADADGDGDLDITVSLKDGADDTPLVLVFEVPGSSANCLLWPTGRGNYRRDGYLPPPS